MTDLEICYILGLQSFSSLKILAQKLENSCSFNRLVIQSSDEQIIKKHTVILLSCRYSCYNQQNFILFSNLF